MEKAFENYHRYDWDMRYEKKFVDDMRHENDFAETSLRYYITRIRVSVKWLLAKMLTLAKSD